MVSAKRFHAWRDVFAMSGDAPEAGRSSDQLISLR
ncbi:hypothetical protein L905_10380 [Agrobacterium sp. TS43]|nr:hypothetical protein L902_21095 [Agrobacterium radiobacter DSM 30147]KVK40063.1 hypothetical protein L904_15465 [Agrobacterium sp. LY4]KVK51479.1 hypothetical protein L903_16500 [Agrobacterium sp. JL28]KVK63675.1 hypothetical protein L906_16450 [Agrobacterium sp. TS45]KVK68103.1 hypothetical protein L907_16410 [Agrobacterium sp. C13]KVK70707.1 hypothetical protein L905_10380 [Agrobacterium sp. TS43]